MATSLKSKIIILITLIMTITAAGVLMISPPNTESRFYIALIFIVDWLVALLCLNQLLKPLKFLNNYARTLLSQDIKYAGRRTPILNTLKKYHDEIGALASAFVFIEMELKKNIQHSQLAAAQKTALECSSQAKSEFIATMSHEIRTPLNGILGYARSLSRQTGLSASQQEGMQVICQCAEHLSQLLNDTLDLAKIEAGKLEYKPKLFSLHDLLDSIIPLFRCRAQEKALSFNVEISTEIPDQIYADDKILRQILINLLSNAVKFTDIGAITLSVFRHNLDNNQIHFQIKDSGVGVPAEQAEKIFQPFAQLVDGQLKDEGTGLGLAISRKLAALINSEIYFESMPGQGSLFGFVVALNAPALKSSSIPVQTSPQLSATASNNLFKVVPLALVISLYEMARIGYHHGLLQEINQLEALGESTRPLANHLNQLVNQFQFDEICTLIEPYVSDTHDG